MPPIQADNTRPVRVVDSDGGIVSTKLNDAPSIKTLDTNNRIITPSTSEPAPTEGALVAEKAADAIPALAEPEKPAEAADDEKITEAKIRREYIAAQKLKREAEAAAKKAKAGLERAEAFEKAREMALTGEDPTALLRAAGLDPIKFYQDLTTYSLSEKGAKEEVDPIKRELAEHKARLDQYAREQEAKEKALQEREEIAAKNQVIQDKVIPLLREKPEQYETLLLQYGNQTAITIFETAYDIYQKTGKARSFEEVANELEKYWFENLVSGHEKALSLKKYKSRIAQSAPLTSGNTMPEQSDTPLSSVTLSNKQSVANTSRPHNPFKGLTAEERKAAILSKFNK